MRTWTLAVAMALLGLVSSTTPSSAQQLGERKTVPGVNNYWSVDKTIATGGSITNRDQAMPALKKLGIKTVVDLAGGADSAAEKAAAEKAGMQYLVFAINSQTLDPAPIDPMLKAISDPANHPVFVHSGNGHRAGMALYVKRVLVDGWTLERAGIQAASAGLVNDNPMTPTWWKFAQEYVNAHKK